MELAGRRERICYADFAFELSLGSPRRLGWLLTPLLDWCRANDLPPLPIIAVRRADGLPSGGYDPASIAPETERVFACDWSRVTPPTAEDLVRHAVPRMPARPRGLRPMPGLRALALAALLIVPALPAHPAEQRPVGSWVLKSGTGKIGSYCTVEAVQGGRTLGLQVVRDGKTFFGLRNPDWSWTSGTTQDAKLTVAGGTAWRGKAIAALPDTLVLPVGPIRGRDPAKVLEEARFLVFEVKGTTMRFDLGDFPNAARAQRDCLATPA